MGPASSGRQATCAGCLHRVLAPTAAGVRFLDTGATFRIPWIPARPVGIAVGDVVMSEPTRPVRRGDRPRLALVLSGGGARGAYEAGVVRYIREELAGDLGGQVHFDIYCGTSVGGIHACFL